MSAKLENDAIYESRTPANIKRRDILVAGLALSVQSFIGSESKAGGLGIPYVNPIGRAYGIPVYRNWTNPAGEASNSDKKDQTGRSMTEVEYIEKEVDIVLSFIKEKGYHVFNRLKVEDLKDTIKKVSSYLMIIRKDGKNFELFSILEQILKLGKNLGISDEETIFLLQIYSYIDTLPRNIILSDGSEINMEKIFGSRFYRGYNNRELLEKINQALKANSKSATERYKMIKK